VLGASACLGRHRPNSDANPRHAAANAWDPRGDGDTNLAGPRIDRRDRKRVEDERVPPVDGDLSLNSRAAREKAKCCDDVGMAHGPAEWVIPILSTSSWPTRARPPHTPTAGASRWRPRSGFRQDELRPEVPGSHNREGRP